MSLRPSSFEEMVGQEKVIRALEISITSANVRVAALGHTLLYGSAGLGKTQIARCIAKALDVPIQELNGAAVRSERDLLPYLVRLENRSVLFIDEIHRLNKRSEEFLFPILEDFQLTLTTTTNRTEVVGDTIEMDLPNFTMIGATTNPGELSDPLRDRFKNKQFLAEYSVSDLVRILHMNAKKLEISLSNEAVTMLAQVSRGTPRIANSLLEWVRDFLLSTGSRAATVATVEKSLAMIGIDKYGLRRAERDYLFFLRKFSEPIGINTLSVGLNTDEVSLTRTVEPYLIKQGYLYRTSRGRALTKKGQSIEIKND